jgi:hypothetical protein
MCISSDKFGILFIEVTINIKNLNTWSAKKTNYTLQDVLSLMWGACVKSSTLIISYEHKFINRDNLYLTRRFCKVDLHPTKILVKPTPR